MDGTFGGGDLISASLAIMLGGGTDAELHDKEVSLSTSQITGSQTAVFEYDPEDEDPQGTPPGPWDGYSLFTIDLSGVKDDIEDLQQQIADMQECWEDVVAALQVYDPEYDPQEGECPSDKVAEVVQAVEDMQECCEDVAQILGAIPQQGESCCDAVKRKAQEVVDENEECDECKAAVIAKLQEYDPQFDPQTCKDIPSEIDKLPGYEFPPKPDGTPQDPDVILPLIATDPLEDTSSRYVPTFYAALENSDTHEETRSNVYAGAFRTAATGRWGGSLGIDIYDKTTKQTVYSSDSALSVGGYGLNSAGSGIGLDTMSIDPTTGVISVTFTWYHVWDTSVRDYVDYHYSKTVTNLTTYFTGYGTGTWKVRNT